VDAFGDRRAVQASTCFNHVANGDDGHRAIMNGALDVKTRRHESRGAQASKHGVDSFIETNASPRPNFIKNESEPRLLAD
jgi:hypothetical protein